MQRLSLQDAGLLYGITANAMRARAKKSPVVYGLERDNAGKLWVNMDVQAPPGLKPASGPVPPVTGSTVHPATQTEIVRLSVALQAAERARDQAESERDQWRSMAQTLAARRSRWWPW